MHLKAFADDPMVFGEDLGVDVVPNATKQRSGTLDVGEKESQRLDFRIVRDAKLRRSMVLSRVKRGVWHTVPTWKTPTPKLMKITVTQSLAGPVWRYVGGMIGFVVAMGIFWYLVSHH